MLASSLSALFQPLPGWTAGFVLADLLAVFAALPATAQEPNTTYTLTSDVFRMARAALATCQRSFVELKETL
jgi:hypothetical protein